MNANREAVKLFGKLCEECLRRFFPVSQRGPVGRFCSPACKQRAHRRAKRLAEIAEFIQNDKLVTRSVPDQWGRKKKGKK